MQRYGQFLIHLTIGTTIVCIYLSTLLCDYGSMVERLRNWPINSWHRSDIGWCIFGPTPIPSTAHQTYKHVVLTAVVGPMHCRSDGHIKNSILVHPTYFKLSLGHVSRSDGPFS